MFGISKSEEEFISGLVDVQSHSDSPIHGRKTIQILRIVVQLLFYTVPFKEPFMKLSPSQHRHTDDCTFCALRKVFEKMEKGLDATKLGGSFQKRIQFGKIVDACGAFEALIDKLQKNIRVGTFTYTCTEEQVCQRCKYASECSKLESLIWSFSGSEFLSLLEENKKEKDKLEFEELFKLVSVKQSKCPKCKKNEVYLSKDILSFPFMMALAIEWRDKDTHSMKKKQLEKKLKLLYQVIKPVVSVNEMFESTNPNVNDYAGKLIGIICYVEGEYVCYYMNEDLKTWFFLADIGVEPLGEKFKEIRKHMLENRCFPNLLFFRRVPKTFDVVKV